jgi:hypothetical protein
MPSANTNATALEIPLVAFEVEVCNCDFIKWIFNFLEINIFGIINANTIPNNMCFNNRVLVHKGFAEIYHCAFRIKYTFSFYIITAFSLLFYHIFKT